MGNHDSKCNCSQCNGSGFVKESAGGAGVAAGALLGGVLLGPVGAMVGGLMRGTVEFDKTCDRCHGQGRTSPRKSPRGWSTFGGRQMTMYHGTSSSNATSICQNGFQKSRDGMLGPGVYLSADRAKAQAYGDTILQVEVRLGKTKKITSQNDPMRKTWSSSGYDSAWVPPGCGMVSSGRY